MEKKSEETKIFILDKKFLSEKFSPADQVERD